MRGLEANYAVHLRLIGDHAVDFLFVLIELFTLGVMAEAIAVRLVYLFTVYFCVVCVFSFLFFTR